MYEDDLLTVAGTLFELWKGASFDVPCMEGIEFEYYAPSDLYLLEGLCRQSCKAAARVSEYAGQFLEMLEVLKEQRESEKV